MPTVVVLQDTTGSPGVTVIPEEAPTAKKWIEEHPAVIVIIAVAVVIILIAIVFYFIRKRRLASSSKEVTINESEAQSAPSPPTELNTNESTEEVLTESFMIIGSPNLHSHHKKRKSTLAMPPAFSVSSNSHHRRSTPSHVQWGRWSSAGLEINSSPPPEAHGNPMPKAYARKKRQSTPGILMAVPVVYRHKRASPAQYNSQAPGSRRQSQQLPSRPLTP